MAEPAELRARPRPPAGCDTNMPKGFLPSLRIRLAALPRRAPAWMPVSECGCGAGLILPRPTAEGYREIRVFFDPRKRRRCLNRWPNQANRGQRRIPAPGDGTSREVRSGSYTATLHGDDGAARVTMDVDLVVGRRCSGDRPKYPPATPSAPRHAPAFPLDPSAPASGSP